MQLCCWLPPMRHYPAYCSDCKRLWLVATDSAPSASPTCPGCGERGRLVPGAYYSDAASTVFEQLEQAVHARQLKPKRLGQLAIELEHLLPTPSEPEIAAAFDSAVQELGFSLDAVSWASAGVGKRVALRFIVIRLIDETARHTGHLDILRELADGVTGD